MKIDKIKIISDHVKKIKDTVSYNPRYINKLKCVRDCRCVSKEKFRIVIKKSKGKRISPLDNLETIKNFSIVNFGYTTKLESSPQLIVDINMLSKIRCCNKK